MYVESRLFIRSLVRGEAQKAYRKMQNMQLLFWRLLYIRSNESAWSKIHNTIKELQTMDVLLAS